MDTRPHKISMRLSEEEKRLADEWGSVQGLETSMAIRACAMLYLRGFTREL